MWLSEQIPTNEWLQILEERSDVRKLYNKHMESKQYDEQYNNMYVGNRDIILGMYGNHKMMGEYNGENRARYLVNREYRSE